MAKVDGQFHVNIRMEVPDRFFAPGIRRFI